MTNIPAHDCCELAVQHIIGGKHLFEGKTLCLRLSTAVDHVVPITHCPWCGSTTVPSFDVLSDMHVRQGWSIDSRHGRGSSYRVGYKHSSGAAVANGYKHYWTWWPVGASGCNDPVSSLDKAIRLALNPPYIYHGEPSNGTAPRLKDFDLEDKEVAVVTESNTPRCGKCPACLSESARAGTCYRLLGLSVPGGPDIAKEPDMVNGPAHYAPSGLEPIVAIEAWGLGFCLGNAIKYIARAAHKGALLQDLRKARWYIEREITKLEALEQQNNGANQ